MRVIAAITKYRPRVPRTATSRRMYSTKQPYEWKTKEWTKLVRFRANGEIFFGEAHQTKNDTIQTAKVIDKDGRVTSKIVNIEKLLTPIEPRAIICIGLNYKRHAAESNLPVPQYPVVFTKNINASQNPGDPIVIPKICTNPQEVDYEAELAVVIGKDCKDVSAANALDYVLGYTCSNDVSARDWQIKRGGSQWCFGKSFDTFAPIGPVLVSPKVIPDPNKLKIGTVLNGKVVQESNTEDMIFNVRQIIQFLSQSTTLVPGTVILTGTPEGVGFARKPPIFLKAGDSVTIDIQNIGKLINPVE